MTAVNSFRLNFFKYHRNDFWKFAMLSEMEDLPSASDAWEDRREGWRGGR